MKSWLDSLVADTGIAARRLRRSPWYTLVLLTTLVVGIASVTAIFSFIYSIYWRPLPFANADRLVAVEEMRRDRPCCYREVTTAVGHEIASHVRAFDRVGFWRSTGADMIVGDDARQISVLLADSSIQQLLGTRPEVGRLLTREEIVADAPVALIHDRIWRAAFGADTAVLGRRIDVNGDLLRIVGVLPPDFAYPWQTDVVRPLSARELAPRPDDPSTVGVLAHLRAGASRAAAAAELNALAAHLPPGVAPRVGKTQLALSPEMLDRHSNRFPLPSFFIGASIFLLLIACSNVTNLVLVRAAERSGEMAVRSSLGASRSRLVQLALTEVVLLTVVAGLLGSAASVAIMKITLRLLPTQGFPYWLRFGLDFRLLGFVLAIVALVTLVVGLAPAREGTRFDLARALNIGGDGGVIRADVTRAARRGLVGQLALSKTLFIAAALFARSYRNATRVDVGYPADHLLDMTLFFNSTRHADIPSRARIASDFAQALETRPGFAGATIRGFASTNLVGAAPKDDAQPSTPVVRDDRLVPDGDSTRAVRQYRVYPSVREFAVGDDYFNVLRLRLQSGRAFDASDAPGQALAVVVSERLAGLLWPKQHAVGRSLRRGIHGETYTVVGVVQDVRDLQGGSRGVNAQPRADAYYSARQVQAPNIDVIAYSNQPLDVAYAAAKPALRSIDPHLVSRPVSIANVDEAKLLATVFGTIVGLFSGAGIVLSVMGLYGVVANGVHRRRREIGVRIALGATADVIVRMLVGQSLRFVATGLGAGLLLSLGVARVAAIVLFDVRAVDAGAYALACLVFGAVALIGCWLPARRAAKINPVAALKSD
jgi:predicted permease